MKRGIIISSLLAAVILFGFQQASNNCDQKTLKNRCKVLLSPFKYDSAKMTPINLQAKKAQKVEVEVPVFIGEHYRLVFNMASAPKGVIINVYSKDKEAKKREVLFSTRDSSKTDMEFIFDMPRVKKLFVDYDVAADSLNTKAKGCAVFMGGYK
jgi:hypothetical protein